MRVVVDTSTLVSALLWSGLPRHLLTAAERGQITPYTSPALLDELAGVLARPKFALRLSALRFSLSRSTCSTVCIAMGYVDGSKSSCYL